MAAAGSGDVADFYDNYYEKVFWQSQLRRGMHKTHQALEAPYTQSDRYQHVLEVGAGGFNHLKFVKHQFDRYSALDSREQDLALDFANTDKKVEYVLGDADRLPYADASIDRLIVTCVLHHLEDPEGALREWRRVVRPKGVISIFLSCDPGIMVRMLRRLGTQRVVSSYGYKDYRLFNARDHRNHFASLDQLIRAVFQPDQVSIKSFPFPWRSWNLNLFFIYQIEING